MECHHVLPKKSGGEDTFENCIPLCFDCHAEVEHYNSSHPKGIKFTADELHKQRDRWYEKVHAGVAAGVPEDHASLDKKLMLRLHSILGGSDEMLHFKDHDYEYSYSQEVEKRLIELLHISRLPESEFFDPRMEASFSDFCAVVENYRNSARARIWFEPNDRAADWLLSVGSASSAVKTPANTAMLTRDV